MELVCEDFDNRDDLNEKAMVGTQALILGLVEPTNTMVLKTTPTSYAAYRLLLPIFITFSYLCIACDVF